MAHDTYSSTRGVLIVLIIKGNQIFYFHLSLGFTRVKRRGADDDEYVMCTVTARETRF